jgi:hypothetical protein
MDCLEAFGATCSLPAYRRVPSLPCRRSKAYPIENLAVPNTGLDAVKLHDGKLLMVHNQLPKPGSSQSIRGTLVLSVSLDDGKTWRRSLTLEVSPLLMCASRLLICTVCRLMPL